MNHRIREIANAAALALWLVASSSPTPAQSPAVGAPPSRAAAPPARSTDEALLREVRLIREMLEQAQGSAQVEQMLVERIRTHDQRVERLDQQLDQIRDEIAGVEVHVRQTQERDKALEVQIQRTSDPGQRQSLEGERKEMTFTQESQTQRLDRLRERESSLAAGLQREERTLRGLEARLEALDREMEAAARKKNAPGQPAVR
jgi:predicted  nucleic acid-binding Zn-ribbon protein